MHFYYNYVESKNYAEVIYNFQAHQHRWNGIAEASIHSIADILYAFVYWPIKRYHCARILHTGLSLLLYKISLYVYIFVVIFSG